MGQVNLPSACVAMVAPGGPGCFTEPEDVQPDDNDDDDIGSLSVE